MGRASGTETDATFFFGFAYEAPTILRLHHQGFHFSVGVQRDGGAVGRRRREWRELRGGRVGLLSSCSPGGG